MRLRTFGGLWIEGEQPPAALGPRRIGLLALVAAAGRRGISRERAMGILWPEAEQELARHTLSQTLYSLKRDTGRDWIVAGTELRLDPAIGSDVGELLDALASGDHEAAAALYSGVFLEGFYIPGAPEFERWVEDERARLRDAVVRVTEQAAAQADRKQDHPAAIRVWIRLTDLDPLSARYAAGRMRALTAAGDRASALDHARRYEALVRRELDAEVDPAIRHLVLRLKTENTSASAVVAPRSVPALVTAGAEPEPHLTIEPPAGQPEPTSPSHGRPRRVSVLLLGAVVLLVLGVTMLRPSTPRPIPFLAVGALRTPELGDTSSLGPVLRDMLATTLGGLEGMQVVANSRLVELTPPASANERSATADAARRAGATEIIEGELITEAAQLVLTLRRVDLARGMVRKGYVVRAAERYALVDSAAATVARDLGLRPPSLAVRDVRTSSPEAYLLYNEGLRAFYGFDAPGAARLMNAALERDSSFAMAAYYVWLISESLADGPTREHAFERVKRLATHTSERERLIIQTEAARREAPFRVAIAIAETLTVRYPTDPDGHIQLGLVKDNLDFAGAVAALQRAFAIDSAAGSTTSPYCRMCLALGAITNTYLGWDSAGAAERVARRMIALRAEDPKLWNGVVEPLLRQGRRAEAEAALQRSGTMNLSFPYGTAALHRDHLRWSRLEELDRVLLSELSSASLVTRAEARWLLLLSLRDQGRLREGRALALDHRIPGSTRKVQGLDPELMLSATLLQDMSWPDSAARILHAGARRVLASTGPRPANRARDATWRLTLAGTAYLAAGDTAVVRGLADSVEIIGKTTNFGRDPLLHHYLRGILLQRAGRHAEAVDQLRRSIFSLSDGYTRINLALARSLLSLGRPAEAIGVLRPAIHGGVDGSNTYTSRTELHETIAEAFEKAGLPDSALVHYRVVELSWRHADLPFRERYLRARLKAGL